jgi:hypothetical protein
MANQAQIESWIASRGLDSDFVKIRVLGEHPSQSEEQFIGEQVVALARAREVTPYLHLPKILGVDVATTNRTVLLLRQGCTILWDRWFVNKGIEEVAALVSTVMDQEQPDAVCIDAVGVGAGVFGLLRHTHYRVINASGSHAVPEVAWVPGDPPDSTVYWNMRAAMWGRMRHWLLHEGVLPAQADVAEALRSQYLGLAHELQQPQWRYAVRGGHTLILLESKDDMRDRGVGSPDEADALSLTFYAPVRPQVGPFAHPGQRYATPAGSPHAPRLGAHRPQRAQGGWGGRR